MSQALLGNYKFCFSFFFLCAIVIYLFKRNPYSFLFMRFSFLFPLFYGVRCSGFGLYSAQFLTSQLQVLDYGSLLVLEM